MPCRIRLEISAAASLTSCSNACTRGRARDAGAPITGGDSRGNFDVDPRPETAMGAAELEAWRRAV